jgi:hypothetical protein
MQEVGFLDKSRRDSEEQRHDMPDRKMHKDDPLETWTRIIAGGAHTGFFLVILQVLWGRVPRSTVLPDRILNNSPLVRVKIFDRLFAGKRFDELDGPLLYVYAKDEQTAAGSRAAFLSTSRLGNPRRHPGA